MLIDVGAKPDPRFVAGANRVDLLRQYFDAGGRLKKGLGHCYHPNPDTVLTDAQILGDALNFAAYTGALEAAEYLLDHGADVNSFAGQFVHYDRGSTSLHKTVMTDGRQAVQQPPVRVVLLQRHLVRTGGVAQKTLRKRAGCALRRSFRSPGAFGVWFYDRNGWGRRCRDRCGL